MTLNLLRRTIRAYVGFQIGSLIGSTISIGGIFLVATQFTEINGPTYERIVVNGLLYVVVPVAVVAGGYGTSVALRT